MKIEEGPAFGALIIGSGVGLLVWQKYGDPFLAVGVGVGIALADYAFLIAIKKFSKK